MKKIIVPVSIALSIFAAGALARDVHDWQDLHKVHVKLQQSIHDMERAQAANHYDMGGHAAKAIDLMRQAEQELSQAVEARNADHH